MKRPAWRGPAIAALALLALSCAPKGERKPQEIVFWVAWPTEAIESLARRFEAENSGLAVRLVQLPWASGQDSLEAALASGAPPDLCQLHNTQLPPFMAGSALSDWSAGVADLRAGLRGWEMCMVGDAIYGLPWLLRTRVLYYNKRLLARAGLDSTRAPRSFEDLRAAAARLHRPRAGVHGYGMPELGTDSPLESLMPFAYGQGRDSITHRPTLPPFEAPLDASVLAFLRALRMVSLVASEDSLERAFVAGRLGLLLAGSGLATRLAREAPHLRYGMALAPTPGLAHEPHSFVAGGEVLVSFTASRHKEDGLKLARFLVRPENAHALATALQIVQPANLGADTTAWYRLRGEQQIMFRQYESARFLPNFPQRVAIEDTLRPLLADAMSGRRTAAQVVALVDTFMTNYRGPR